MEDKRSFIGVDTVYYCVEAEVLKVLHGSDKNGVCIDLQIKNHNGDVVFVPSKSVLTKMPKFGDDIKIECLNKELKVCYNDIERLEQEVEKLREKIAFNQ